MPHDVRSPHIFQDGPGNTASGEQVMDNLDAIWAAIDLLVAPGTIRMSGTASPESGWLLCDGAAVSRTTYAALFAKCGTAFGTGDGSTTFNLPDLRGRSPMGAGTGASPTLAARTLGAKVGEQDHTLSTSEIPSHSHTYTMIDYGLPPLFVTAGGDQGVGSSTSNSGSTGGGGSHNNVQPNTVVSFFIKT